MIMVRCLLLSLVLWSCSQHKKDPAPEQPLSMTIAGDSVVIYHWEKGDNTSYPKIVIDEIAVKAILAKEKANADTATTVLLKLSDAVGGGFMNKVHNLRLWAIESGFRNIIFADAEPEELASLHLESFTWATLDSIFSRPHPLNLIMPKEDPADTFVMPVELKKPAPATTRELPQDNTFVIEIKADQSVWYQLHSLTSKMVAQKVDPPVTKNLEKIIADHGRASVSKKITYLIKGDKAATYPVFEQVINALKAYNIYKYNLITSE